jgi:hypothetical protein
MIRSLHGMDMSPNQALQRTRINRAAELGPYADDRPGLLRAMSKPALVSRRSVNMATVNGVRLYYELNGTREVPLVLVHGSWDSHEDWDLVVPRLADSFQVLTYDRRGHSKSERPTGRGSVREDVADLAALIEHLGLGLCRRGWSGTLSAPRSRFDWPASVPNSSEASSDMSRRCSRCSPMIPP